MMTAKGMMVCGSLLLSLLASTGTLVRGQDLLPPVEASPVPGESLWYGEFPAQDGGKKDAYLDCCSPCPRVYGYVEALFLERSNCSFDQPILVQSVAGVPVATYLATSDLDFDCEPAVRALFGVRLHGGWALEGSYLGLFHADTSVYTPAPDASTNLTFPGDLGFTSNVFSDPDEVWTRYTSSLHSGELNLVCCQGCCDCYEKGKGDPKGDCGGYYPRCQTFEWFVGFRYLNLRETLNIYGEREQQISGGGFETEDGVYNIRTNNNLYGAQVGARLRHWGRRWGWEGTGKAGIFANDAQQEQYVLDFPNEPEPFPLRPLVSSSTDRVAFVGELNLTAIYRLNDNWNLRGGYNLIWVDGLALAPNQLDFGATEDSGRRLSSNGGLFLHGVSCGIEARW